MAITSYEKNGRTYYRVKVNDRSKKFREVRLQRSKSGIESLAAARREEDKLTREVYELLVRAESKGMTWLELIQRWELHAIHDRIGQKYPRERINFQMSLLYRYTHLWMTKRVGELNRSDGRYLINLLLRKSLSISTIKKVKGAVGRVWLWAVEEGFINENIKSPMHGMMVQDEKPKYKPILTIEEVKKLLYEAEVREHPCRHIWAVAILTGMRSGELFALTWDDVDFDNNIIRITKSYSQRLRGIKSTKSAEWRNAHISEELREVLLNLRMLYPHEELVLPRILGWSSGNGGKVLRDFLKEIGIDRYVTFHTLRACFATHSLTSGAEAAKVMKMGGWSDLKTFQIYVRMAGVDVKGVTDRLKIMPRLNLSDNVISLN